MKKLLIGLAVLSIFASCEDEGISDAERFNQMRASEELIMIRNQMADHLLNINNKVNMLNNERAVCEKILRQFRKDSESLTESAWAICDTMRTPKEIECAPSFRRSYLIHDSN